MARDTGFFQLRRGIWEHVRDGRLSLQDVAVHQYIASQADTRTGVWNGSAGALAGELCISPRMARRFVERLTRGDYIRRFPVPGRHICYPILVHKFLITDGQHKGEQLNALASTSPADLRYFAGEQKGELEGEQKGEHVSSQKRLKTIEERQEKKPAAKPAPPADPRYQPFFDHAYKTFQAKHGGKAPSWMGKDHRSLKTLLAANRAVTVEEMQKRWNYFLASTDRYHVSKGDSLSHFCTNFDSFINGPIMEKGKPDAQDALTRSLANSGLDANGRLAKIQ